MPNEWRETTFSKLCDITRGASPRPIHEWVSATGIPWVKISDATSAGSRFLQRTAECIRPEGQNRSVSVHPGDLILSNSASPGLPMFMGIEACIHDGWLLLRNLRGLDKLFAYYLLLYESPSIVRQGTGSVFTNLKTEILKNHVVRLPPLPVQRSIARILGALDDKIELNRKMNETLEQMARAIFKSWFVDFEPFRDKGMVDSPLGKIPKGWRVGTLGEVAANPRRPVGPTEIRPGTPYIALEHMPRRSICLADWGIGDEVESGKSAFRKGEVLFGKLRPYFHKVGVAPLDGVCSTDILVVAPKSPHWLAYVLGQVSSDAFVAYSNAGSEGTKMPRTNWARMAGYTLATPTDGLASAFNEHAAPMLAGIVQNIWQSRTLAAIRDALLPKLMNGEIRTANDEVRSANDE